MGAESVQQRGKEIEHLIKIVEQFRAKRFKEVRQALEVGTYHVSGEDIARKLMESNRK